MPGPSDVGRTSRRRSAQTAVTEDEQLNRNKHIVATGMDFLYQMQWPAMVVTVLAAWLIASQNKRKRVAGFWLFLVSNVLWVLWGWHVRAYALIALQIALAILNVRGVSKNAPS